MTPRLLDLVIAFSVPGEPITKARARVFFDRRTGKARGYTPKDTVEGEERVGWYAKAQAVAPRDDIDFAVEIEFRCQVWQRRDVDNMTKLVFDALNGIVWKDDSQVRSLAATVEKGVAKPSTEVRIFAMEAQRGLSRPCDECGKPLRTYRSWSGDLRLMFCGAICRAKFRLERKRRECPVCGTSFLPTSTAPRRYCSTKCQPNTGRPVIPTGDPIRDADRLKGRESRQRQREMVLAGIPRPGPQKKDRCRSGLHEMVGDNVKLDADGSRHCRGCRAIAAQRVVA